MARADLGRFVSISCNKHTDSFLGFRKVEFILVYEHRLPKVVPAGNYVVKPRKGMLTNTFRSMDTRSVTLDASVSNIKNMA